MFDLNELQQLVYFLNRAALNGTESIAHATLLSKIQRLIESQNAQQE